MIAFLEAFTSGFLACLVIGCIIELGKERKEK